MSWLSNYAKRIKLTIDHTKVDSTLTDFPVLVTLASGTGINNADVSDVFDSLAVVVPASINDSFTGSDDSSVSATLWTVSNPSYQSIQSNKLRMVVPVTTPIYTSARTNFKVTGDFDVRVDWERIGTISPSVFYTQLSAHCPGEDQAFFLYYQINSSWLFNSQTRVGAAYVGEISTTVTYTTTKLRLTRVGTTWTSYYWNGSSWVTHRVSNRLTGVGPVFFVISAENYPPNYPSGIIEFDNFEVTAASIIPYDENVNRKKIAITTEDGTTQCPVEIERWDQDNEQAWLWTKLPLVYSDRDTDFYLYYDKNQVDNTNVGDINTAAAQSVWSNGFLAVYHMSQDPALGASSIKNSVSSGYLGSPQGSMTSADLVDSKIGKAIDFDGSDDYIDVVNGFGLDGVNQMSVSFIVKPDIIPFPAGTYPGVVCRGNESDRTPWIYGNPAGTGDRINFMFSTTSTQFDGSGSISCTQGEFVAGDLCWDGTNVTFYRDGEFAQSDTTVGNTLKNTTGEDFIGNMQGYHKWNGIIEEVRISNVNRTASWVKASYNSSWNQLISYGTIEIPPTHYYDGYITEASSPVVRQVLLYNRNTGALMGTSVSDAGTGYYYVTTTISGEHFIVVLDDALGESYNALIADKLLPRGIE